MKKCEVKFKNKADKVIRVGDKVKIVKAYFFVRCGYPLTVDDLIEKVDEEWREKVESFIRGLGLSPGKISHQILRSLAYGRLEKEGFGGRERRIHTREHSEHLNKEAEVTAIRYVKTGDYSPGYVSSNYYGEYDYEPAYLTNEKTHKILTLGIDQGLKLRAGKKDRDYTYKIEARNVRKL